VTKVSVSVSESELVEHAMAHGMQAMKSYWKSSLQVATVYF